MKTLADVRVNRKFAEIDPEKKKIFFLIAEDEKLN